MARSNVVRGWLVAVSLGAMTVTGTACGGSPKSAPTSTPSGATRSVTSSAASDAATRAPTTTPASPTTETPPRVTIGGWTGREPALIYFSADAGNVVTALTWSAWGAREAVGHGTRNVLACVPSCAEGATTPYPVTITLSNAVNGEFTSITEQTADPATPTETFDSPHLGQGACTTIDESTCRWS